MKLTQKQINNFEQNGFLILKNFADTKLCEEILQKAIYHFENEIPPFESEQQYLEKPSEKSAIRRLRQVYDREEIFKTWMTNKKIKPILKQLLGNSPILILAHHNSIMTKTSITSSQTSWHQDIRYWNYQNQNLISVWLSLGDESLKNGILKFIPKSHTITFHENQFDKKSNFLQNIPENEQLINTAVFEDLQKGDIVLFHCKTLHFANKNETNKTKFSFVYTVRANDNYPIVNTRSDFNEIVL